ncbi:MAG TPA: hypothetical protein PKJ25_10430 [Smithellaceae bacterium]|nr:hypothetical protein [Smithellaceae bacterium]
MLLRPEIPGGNFFIEFIGNTFDIKSTVMEFLNLLRGQFFTSIEINQNKTVGRRSRALARAYRYAAQDEAAGFTIGNTGIDQRPFIAGVIRHDKQAIEGIGVIPKNA